MAAIEKYRLGDSDINLLISCRRGARYLRLGVRNGVVILSKPASVSRASAFDFLEKNAKWVAENLAKKNITLGSYLEDGAQLFFDGRIWSVRVCESRTDSFWVRDASRNEIIFMRNVSDPHNGLENLFIEFARRTLPCELARIAQSFGISYTRASVRNQSGRWASRSSSGVISLNWRIALLPEELQRYVLCHELAHTKFMDHSVSFWIYLNRLCPDAKALDRRLTRDGKRFFSMDFEAL